MGTEGMATSGNQENFKSPIIIINFTRRLPEGSHHHDSPTLDSYRKTQDHNIIPIPQRGYLENPQQNHLNQDILRLLASCD